MSYDTWAQRVTLTVAAVTGLWVTLRGTFRVLRSMYRVHAMLLGVGVPGDPDYRPGMDARLEQLETQLEATRAEVASTHLVAVEAIVETPTRSA